MIQLPKNIEASIILTALQKQQLSAVAELPVVDPAFEDDRLKNIFQYYSLMPDEMDAELDKYAAELLTEGKVNEAWQVLLSSDIM